ncbi:MAG: beta-lactamase family protein [Asgard group archaeon]|nr:beta-lactamase family protein [Asgard group archaeon]
MSILDSISGFVKPEFEDVEKAFIENFQNRNELGAACCIYYQGEKVVDLWGGIRNEATGEPWEENTMVIVWSTTKGLSALALALAQSRGLFDYDERISKYWPEFAQQGKENITIRQLLAHQAGLYSIENQNDKNLIADLDKLAVVLAKQKPAWKPGMYQGYHAITLGYYQNELLRRVDPKKRTIGQYFQDEIATPLGLDLYIRLPEEIPNSRLAILRLAKFGLSAIRSMPFSFVISGMNPSSVLRKSLLGTDISLDEQHIYARNFEAPSGGGVGTARAIAQVYSVFATGGKELGLKEETLQQLMAPPIAPTKGFHDKVMKSDLPFSLGFVKSQSKDPFGSPSSFGMPGSGGSFGFADPEAKIGYAYTPNGMGLALKDPRDIALRKAMNESISKLNK